MYCSDVCYIASKFYRQQLSDEPAYLRSESLSSSPQQLPKLLDPTEMWVHIKTFSFFNFSFNWFWAFVEIRNRTKHWKQKSKRLFKHKTHAPTSQSSNTSTQTTTPHSQNLHFHLLLTQLNPSQSLQQTLSSTVIITSMRVTTRIRKELKVNEV